VRAAPKTIDIERDVNAIERFVGVFEGTGTWHDAAGQSSAYRIRQHNHVTPDGFEVAFKHDFEDGTVVDARFTMTWITPHLFRVTAAGAAVGSGYVFDGYCHYHLKVGDAFVEASYRSSAGGLEVFGSSTSNAEGHYIAWTETLGRTAAESGQAPGIRGSEELERSRQT
jgi:hypothetical protein